MGSDVTARAANVDFAQFQFTLPHGERRFGGGGCDTARRFNSRSRMGSDSPPLPVEPPLEVSIHAPAWGATVSASSSPLHCQFQFTLPHGERLEEKSKTKEVRSVSIHAPAWGATGRPWLLAKHADVSIHAPAWGATGRPWAARRRRQRFNSRSRMGSDIVSVVLSNYGAGFNSRSRMGSDITRAGA